MTSRERVKRAIRFEMPDRIPIMHSVLPAARERHGHALERILRRYPSDYGVVDGGFVGYSGYVIGEGVDSWGVRWESERDGILGLPVGHPLEDWGEFNSYEPPDPNRLEFRAPSSPRVDQGYLLAWGGNLFERAQWLRGYEGLLMDIAEGSGRVRDLLDMIVCHNLALIARWEGCDIDGVEFWDDWGTQDALMIAPSDWRKLFRPRYAEIFDAVHALGFDVHFHSDGQILDIVDDLMEIGADVMNCQIAVMDRARFDSLVRGRICLRSDLDRQHVLPHGVPEEVRLHVRDVVARFNKNGGVIGCGEIGPDVPLANVEAMFAAFQEYGGQT
jgi:hypothetical protein